MNSIQRKHFVDLLLDERALDEIDTALRILYEDPGRFGVCAVCGHRISLGRLALVPTTRYCQEHAPGN